MIHFPRRRPFPTSLRRCRRLEFLTSLALGLMSLFMPPSGALADEWIVADRVSNRLLAFDAVSGAYRRVVVASGLDVPAAVAFGPGGFLYVANLQLGNVLKVDPQTGSATPFVSGILGPGGLAFDATSNTLFVGEFGNFNGRNVYQYDASGTLLKTIDASPTGHGGLTVDATGDLYVSAFAVDATFGGAVFKFDAQEDYAPLGVFATGSGLSGANGLVFDADGDLFAAGLFGQSVVKYDVDQGSVVGGANFSGVVAYPSGVALASNGELIVTSLGNNNPDDVIWGNNLFPGALLRFNPTTGARSPFLIGDFSGNLVVDAADLAIWENGFAASATGDSDLDGDSDGADFLAWQRSVGNEGYHGDFQPTSIAYFSPPGVASLVPEPISLWMGAVALVARVRRPRRGTWRGSRNCRA